MQDRERDLDLIDPGGEQERVDEVEATAVMATKLGRASLAAVVMNVELSQITKTRRSGKVRATTSRKLCTAPTECFLTTLPSARPVRTSKVPSR